MKFKIHCVSCLSHFKHWIATCGWDSMLDGANIGHSHHQRTFYWTAVPARLVLIHSILSPVVICDACWKVMSIRHDPTAPLSCLSAVHLSVYFMVCSLFLPRRKLAGYGSWNCLKNRMGWEFRLVEAEDQSAHLTLSLSLKWRKEVPLTGD